MEDVDAPLLTSFITGESLCAECIAHKTGLAVTRVDEIAIGLHTNAKVARCAGCLKQTVVHRLGTMGARSREQTNRRTHGSRQARYERAGLYRRSLPSVYLDGHRDLAGGGGDHHCTCRQEPDHRLRSRTVRRVSYA
jgi:hypothetical protein